MASAKVCLLDPVKRTAYDQQLLQQMRPEKLAASPAPSPQHAPLRSGSPGDELRNQTTGDRSGKSYTAEISRVNPTCFLFLVDQSASMGESFGGAWGKTKAQGVADAINRLFQTLVSRCAKGAYVLDRYYIGAIGYNSEVFAGCPLPVSEIAKSPIRIEERIKKVEDPATKLVEEHRVSVPIWFEPQAKGKTCMCAALQSAHGFIQGFVRDHPGCFPPIVINITDGKPTDGDPRPNAAALRNIASRDGNTLLFNLHISAGSEKPILFPSSESSLPDNHARLLFRMSSPLPMSMLRQASLLGRSVGTGAVGFAFNSDLASVITFLDIGTRVDRRIA